MPIANDSDCDVRIIVCLAFHRHARPKDIGDLKNSLTVCAECMQTLEVTGTFDFMVELSVDDFRAYDLWQKRFADPFAELVDRYEVNIVCNRFVRQPTEEDALWVPSQCGLERVDCSTLNKVTAEGDYVRLHSDGHSWMLHATMRSLMERLDPWEFIQIHRSTIVRRDFIERLVHEGRHWIAKLEDGTVSRIAKSHVAPTIDALRTASPMPEADSPKTGEPAESLAEFNEK